jgi:hypothetical protein
VTGEGRAVVTQREENVSRNMGGLRMWWQWWRGFPLLCLEPWIYA